MIFSNMKQTFNNQSGFVTGAVVTSIVFGLLALVFGSVMIWALVNYNDQKNNVDQKILAAQEVAINKQKAKDQDAFEEKEKNPLAEFVGPTDLGRVNFKYPKTWSVYVASDGASGNNYQAYLHPGAVPQAGTKNKFALQVSIVGQSYDQVLGTYSGKVKQGDLRSSAITANGFNGQRFDGKFTDDVDGSVAVFKIRDKTLILKTDSTAFKPDFDDKVIKTLSFDQ
ncbi:hypothetical protein HY004_03055 [Candidatus Saccharibacteria bacterium]|nr:hypothetical protein [Candidatus Saccharibacteria bacterium]